MIAVVNNWNKKFNSRYNSSTNITEYVSKEIIERLMKIRRNERITILSNLGQSLIVRFVAVEVFFGNPKNKINQLKHKHRNRFFVPATTRPLICLFSRIVSFYMVKYIEYRSSILVLLAEWHSRTYSM